MSYDVSELELTADFLKEKQSVRATFRLPVQVIKIVSIAASQLGIKQKTLIDQLVEDHEILTQLAREALKFEPTDDERQQKTYVLSRKSLHALEKVSGEFCLPRDVLIEISVNRLLPIIHAEKNKLAKRIKMLADLEAFQREGEALLKKALHSLGSEDPAVQQLAEMLKLGDKNIEHTRHLIEQGRIVEQM